MVEKKSIVGSAKKNAKVKVSYDGGQQYSAFVKCVGKNKIELEKQWKEYFTEPVHKKSLLQTQIEEREQLKSPTYLSRNITREMRDDIQYDAIPRVNCVTFAIQAGRARSLILRHYHAHCALPRVVTREPNTPRARHCN